MLSAHTRDTVTPYPEKVYVIQWLEEIRYPKANKCHESLFVRDFSHRYL